MFFELIDYVVSTPRGTSRSGKGLHYKYHNENIKHDKSSCKKCSSKRTRKHKG